MFDITFSVSGKLDGGYKKTICRIFRVYDEMNKDLVSAATAFWNNTADCYDLREGKKVALEKAYAQMPKSAKQEFDEWINQ